MGWALAEEPRLREPCLIEVVDESNDWPVPLVTLRTTHEVEFVTDNAGRVAFDLPELMGQEVWMSVEGHGYQVAADAFGYRGVKITPTPGGEIQIPVQRQNLAKRLGRLTGAGLFAESQQLGHELTWPESGVLGCDTVQTARLGDRLWWSWGDTTLANHPLGLFHITAATTPLRALDRYEPPLRLTFSHYRDGQGRVREVARMPGEGPTWIAGATTLVDRKGQEQLVACYSKIEPPLSSYEVGLCVWNEEKARFVQQKVLWNQAKDGGSRPSLLPEGHPVSWTDEEGKEWMLFGDPFPRLKCPATFESWLDPAQWVALEAQQTVPARTGGREIRPHRGSLIWSPYREKWVTLFTEFGGESSPLGEVWYAEAGTPFGPWEGAVPVLSHANYTFYNPKIHPELTAPEASFLLFEGTYTQTFADNPIPTPRYDYNQVLYRLDLADVAPRLP
ncbi:hypothetical protein JIN78_02095 [Roseibacillus ishigakijimensis]|uniref:DUF4185 domain-containing protein n=1 Tax=Roseibacillus ishigakijimensis TaxID=454146 RepID=A0A934RPQ1_9BACT|nr:hypothetical protein [Roseibacillus ishigakijimensis]